MRSLVFLFFASLMSVQTLSQPSDVPSGPPKKSDLFAAAEPFYNFSDPSLKPLHLRASYQLYDENGDPTEKGTYEYWWVSPMSSRSTWTRKNATQTYWHTSDGKQSFEKTGEPLQYSEVKLEKALFSPLPDDKDLDPTKFRFEKQPMSMGPHLNCVMITPLTPQPGMISNVQMGLFPTYCFAKEQPVLRVSFSFGTLTTAFNKVVKVQDHYLAEEVLFFDGKRKILTANVDVLDDLDPSDAALIPPPGVQLYDTKKVNLPSDMVKGTLINKKKIAMVYPQDARLAHIQGKVVLRAIIGMDGGIHELHVISTPWPSLAASALRTVSQYQYKPYTVNGQPVEVQTEIDAIFTLN